MALNDDLSFYARLVLLFSGAIVLALAHREPDDERAGEFFGALLMMNAGAMIVAAANEMVFLFVGLELVSIPTYLILYLSRRRLVDAGGSHQVFLPEHIRVGLVSLRADVSVRNDRREQPEGTRVLFRDAAEPAASRSSAWWRWSS